MLQNYDRYGLSLAEDIARYRSLDEKVLKDTAAAYLPVGKGRKILIAKPTSVSVAKKGN